jgi:hypothetical protein
MARPPALAAWLLGAALAPAAQEPANTLAPWEQRLGWELLFDGRSLAGWHPFARPGAAPTGWTLDGEALHHASGAGGGDLVSERSFADFELELEWKAAPGANSGVKYRFREDAALGGVLGPEYQILDDAAHADGASPETSSGALYALYPAAGKALAPAGEWNRARIVAHGTTLEHWLNGRRLLVAEVGSADWEARRLRSKFARQPDFGRASPAPLALQDHGDAVWFRNLKIRDLTRPPGAERALLDAMLSGWRTCGAARFALEDGVLVGTSTGGKGFLASERTFADFVLELEVSIDPGGNSGIQVRSSLAANGLVEGYQIEIDSSPRAWSGGLFREGGSWLQDLAADEQARAAFRPGEWNCFRIECCGPVIRARVNGIPTCDYRQARETGGILALQVHDPGTRVRIRNLRLWELR